MNILHVTPYYAPAYAFGGVVRSVEGMARALARRGHRVTILTTDALNQTEHLGAPPREMLDSVQVIRARNFSPFLRGRFNLSTPFALRHLARDLMPDAAVIHVHEFRTVENLLVTPAAGSLGKPLILSPHGTLTPTTGRSALKSAWDALLSPAVARRFGHVIGLTQAEADEARALWARFGASAQFTVIPNGVNPDEYTNLPPGESFRAKFGLGDSAMCLFMARLHPRKGAHLLAEAFLRANIPDARLVIAGPDEGGLRLIPHDARITLTGYLSGQDRLAAFAAADLFALPAVGEGLPMGVLEAMAAGLPVLISPGCNLPEVEQYSAGLIVEPRLEPMANALAGLLADADRRRVMGAAARRLVSERFTWESIAVRLEQVYQSML